MFGSTAKTPFGTGTFGSSNTSAFGGGQTTPFGQPSGGLFGAKTQGTSAFGTPSFGATTTPAFGGGSTSTGLFGTTNTGGSLFSQPSTQATGGGLFGSSTQSSSLFQAPQSSSVFGQSKPTAFGSLGTSSASTGMFGSTFGASAAGSSFGASTATSSGTGGLFGTSSVFGGATATNGTTIKFNPVTNSESVMKNGVSMMVQTRHQCISVMKEYESKSLEELRLEDYTAGRKSGSSASSLFASTGASQTPSLFGGTTGSAFGQNKTSAFGGLTQKTTGTGLFGQTTQSGGLFSSKPTGTGSIFGPAKTTASTGFGFGATGGLLGQTSTSGTTGSLFGSTGQSTGGLFGASSGFGQTQTTSTGGLFGTSSFGQQQSGGLFGATSKPFGFGAAATSTNTFGTGAFGTGTSTGLFGGTATSKSAFSTNTGTGAFGSSLGGFGTSNTLGTGLFGATSSSGTGTGLFGGQTKTGFGTGLGTTTGLGTGLGGTSAFGATGGFGGLGTTTGLAANQGLAGISGINQSSFAAFQQQQVLQQQLKALANSPFGDSPLFRNLTASRRTKEQNLLVSGPANVSNSSASHYKVFSKPAIRVKKKPSPFPSSTKSKLFEDIYDDNSLSEPSLTPRSSVKKLVIKNKYQHLTNGEGMSSPLRFRTFTDDDDDNSDLIARVPEVPVAPVLQEGAEPDEEASASATESPALQQARKKTSFRSLTDDSQGIDNQSASLNAEEDQTDDSGAQEESKNACGVILERDDYYTIPSIEELNERLTEDGACDVENFVVGREDYGEVKFLGITNVKDLNLDEIVFFRRREAEVYPDNYEEKPDVGVELNKKSEISLLKVWPNDKTSHTPIKTPERLKKSGFIERLEEKTSAMGALFLDYKPDTGTWVFQVDHFTRYGLNEQLFADDGKEDLINKLKTAAQKKDAAKALEAEKERARLTAEKLKKEKEMELEMEMEVHDHQKDADADGMIAESEDESHFVDDNGFKETGCAGPFSTSIQNAKISGVDPFRLQGMKAVLFDDEEEDFLSPREKTFLASKSLITGSVREVGLKERFDSAKKLKSGKEKLDFSLLSETTSPLASPKKVPLKSQLLKTTSFLGGDKALRSKVADSSTAGLFSPIPNEFQDNRQPSIITANHDVSLVPFQVSSLASKENLAADAALTNGRRFRVGWAPKLRLVHVGEPVGAISDCLKYQQKGRDSKRPNIFDPASRSSQTNLLSNFTVKVEDISVDLDYQDDSYLVDCLKNCLKHCNIDAESSVAPFIEPADGVSSLHGFADLTHKFKERLGSFPKTDTRYQHAIIWDLFKALWGKLEHRTEDKLTAYQNRILRRAALSKWLSNSVEHDIKKEVDAEKFKDSGHLDAIYSLLTGRQIASACKIAYQNREFRLALLLSQASGDVQLKMLLREQLGEWKDQKADKFMNLKRLKIYQLLSGMMVWMSSKGDINVCENLDWKRAFAVHLWYYCPTTASISKALLEYKHSFRGTDSYSPYAEAPSPCYVSNQQSTHDDSIDMDKSEPKDICYHLLKLFSKRSHRLESTLCPNTHTSNPLDYALCWQMQQVLQSLGYTHISEQYHCLLQASFASQLETYGLWEWAVYVLLHIKDPHRREIAVRDILARHCHASEDCNKLSGKELFLIESVKIPPRWIFEAKALHAHYCSKPHDEAVYLLKGGHWNSAHQVILREMASDAIIDEDYTTLKELLLQLCLPERCCTVKNWTQSGQIFLDYILLREKLFEIVEGDLVVTAYSLEDLRGDVTSLINRIGNMTADSPKERLAQAEMGKTSSNLLKIVVQELAKKGHCGDDDDDVIDTKYTWSMCELAPYIAYLPLPPDYKQKELEELVSFAGDRVNNME